MAGYLEPPSGVPVESDHYLSYLAHPSIHHGVGGSGGDAADTRSSVEAREEFRSLLVHGHRNRSSSAHPTCHQGWGCTAHTQQEVEGEGNAYTVAVPGVGVAAVAVAAGEVVAGGGVEGDVESVTGGVEGAVVTHKNEVRVGMNDHTQGQVGDSVSLPGSGLAAMLSRPGSDGFEQEPVGEAEGRECYIRSVEGKNVVKASEGEGKYNGARTNYTSEH